MQLLIVRPFKRDFLNKALIGLEVFCVLIVIFDLMLVSLSEDDANGVAWGIIGLAFTQIVYTMGVSFYQTVASIR